MKFNHSQYYLSFFVIIVSLGIFWFARTISTPKENSAEHYPADWFYQQRAFPFDNINYEAYKVALTQAKQFKQNYRANNPLKSWKFIGPINIGGRITDVEMHASDVQTIYAGTATGGVFKSTNAGSSWLPIFDNESSLSIGDLAVAPSDPKVIYVGTGEANAGGGSTTYDGSGVFKSIDAGNSWTYVGLEKIRNTGRIVINPKNVQNVFVAGMGDLYGNSSERGIFRTIDGGSHWEKVLYVSDSTGGIDLVINPKNPNVLYAAMWERVRTLNRRTYGGKSCNIYQSLDGGTTWKILNNGLPISSTNSGRIGLAISESNPDVLYAIYADKIGYFAGIYKTINGGTSWARVNDSGLNNLFASYGWWFGRISVDPKDPNIVFAIGYELHKSTDGGLTWREIGANIHVDHHSIYVHPKNSNYVVLGNDGGLFISQNAGINWVHMNNLPITQFYTCEVDYKNPNRYYGGAQDNNVIRTTTGKSNDWYDIIGGDGLVVLVDPINNSFVYAESQYGALGKSSDGGNNFKDAITGISTSDRTNWNTPVVFDPSNPQILYYGTNRMYKSIDRAANWNVISPDLTNGNGGNNIGTLTCIAVAPSNSSVIYAGTDDGNAWRTTDGGLNWKKISATLPVRWVTKIAVDLKNPSIAYITLSGFRKNEYLSHLYKTIDGGLNWMDISGNLPEAPLNDVIIDPIDNSTLYVASDVGVYKSASIGTWAILGDSLPNVPITDLTLHHPTRMLVAATYGRSMYKFDLGIPTYLEDVSNNSGVMQIYPNPIHDKAIISLKLNETKEGNLSLYDLAGNKIYEIYQGILKQGDVDIKWNAKGNNGIPLKSGTYFIRLESAKGMEFKKIQIVN